MNIKLLAVAAASALVIGAATVDGVDASRLTLAESQGSGLLSDPSNSQGPVRDGTPGKRLDMGTGLDLGRGIDPGRGLEMSPGFDRGRGNRSNSFEFGAGYRNGTKKNAVSRSGASRK
jgi:hypothetical protein